MVTTIMNPNFVQNQCIEQVVKRVYKNCGHTDYANIVIVNLFPTQIYVNP